MSLEQTHYSVVLLGTGLAEAVLAAALSKAGHSVLHADPAPFYGDRWASLSLRELVAWAQTSPDTHLTFPAFSDSAAGETPDVPAALAKVDRHYALSLTPALLPSAGAALDILVRSRVASYATFRLLERTLIFEAPETQAAQPTFRSVPCSKEDIFRDRSLPLADKRRVMKLLMGVAAGQDDGHNPEEPFLAYLQSKHGISAPIARAIAYGVSLCSSPDDATGMSLERAAAHLKGTGKYGNSAYLVGQYGGAGELAQSYCRVAAVHGATYILGRPVESLKLADEKARSTSAEAAEDGSSAGRWKLRIADIEEEISADWVVGSSELIQQALHEAPAADTAAAASHDVLRCLLVLDRSLPLTAAVAPTDGQPVTPPDTALVVFPPGVLSAGSDEVVPAQAVSVLIMGEGTFSCPKGQYVYYLSTPAGAVGNASAENALAPVVDALLRLAAQVAPEWRAEGTAESSAGLAEAADGSQAPRPLLQLFHRQRATQARLSHGAAEHLLAASFPPSSTGPAASLATALDAATQQAEELFWSIEGEEARRASMDRAERRRRRRDPAEYVGRAGAEPREEEEIGTGIDFFGPDETEAAEEDQE